MPKSWTANISLRRRKPPSIMRGLGVWGGLRLPVGAYARESADANEARFGLAL